MFIDGYECSDVIEDWNNFLTKIEDFKPYMVEFKKDIKLKPKVYSFDCIVRSND